MYNLTILLNNKSVIIDDCTMLDKKEAFNLFSSKTNCILSMSEISLKYQNDFINKVIYDYLIDKAEFNYYKKDIIIDYRVNIKKVTITVGEFKLKVEEITKEQFFELIK